MRSWIFGGLLAAVTTSGIAFVAAGAGNPNHCGPCVACREAKPAIPATPGEPVDGEAALKRPAPRPLAFVSFDEPPLANPPARPLGEIIPAAYTEPAASPQTPAIVGAIPLATSADPY